MQLVADDVYRKNNCSDHRDEDEEAPAGAQAVWADEDLVESRRLRGWKGFAGCQRWVGMEGLVVGFIVQEASSRDRSIYGGSPKLVRWNVGFIAIRKPWLRIPTLGTEGFGSAADVALLTLVQKAPHANVVRCALRRRLLRTPDE